MQRRQEMLRGINTGDAVLLLGGDLNVTVVQAQVGKEWVGGDVWVERPWECFADLLELS
jgi:preprotein translocase subunit YajC